MTSEWRIQVSASAEPREFSTADGGDRCMSLTLTPDGWAIYLDRRESSIREEYASIVAALPEVQPYVHIQSRDVSEWKAA